MAKFLFTSFLADWIENQQFFMFDWDSGNVSKNFTKHKITTDEAESVFKQTEAIRVLGLQVNPEVNEKRYGLLGLTSELKHVFVCFTIRGLKIRIIHIRKMNTKERKFYAQLCQE